MEKFIHYLDSRQTAYARLPRFVQIIITGITLLFGVAGVVLTFSPISDVGVLIVLIALCILSFEFAWALKSRNYLIKLLRNKNAMLVIGLIAVAALAIILYLGLHHR